MGNGSLTEGKPFRGKEGKMMLKLLKVPHSDGVSGAPDIDQKGLEALVCAMGKRLQAEYIEGAIPYLRMQEPEVWKQLEELDR
jgi:hypothetical protein